MDLGKKNITKLFEDVRNVAEREQDLCLVFVYFAANWGKDNSLVVQNEQINICSRLKMIASHNVFVIVLKDSELNSEITTYVKDEV